MSSAPFHQHYGQNNVLTDNIFAFGSQAVLMRTRAEDHLSFTLQHNIVLSSGSPMLASDWSGNGFTTDYNDYWVSSGAVIKMGDDRWLTWLRRGNDTHSIIADPGFENPKDGNFTLSANSPAISVGFKPFDLNDFGCDLTQNNHKVPAAFPKFNNVNPQ
jgi:hypothetical protein